MSAGDGAAPAARGALDPAVIAPFLFVSVCWSTSWYIIKDQIGLAPPGWTIAARFTIGAVAMAALAMLRGESLRLPAPALRLAAIVGTSLFCINFQCVYRAEQSLTSGITAILMSLMMVPTAIGARIVFKVPIERWFVIGSGVAVAGIGLLLLNEYRVAPPATGVGIGLLFGMGALAGTCTANVAQMAPAARDTPAVPLTAWAMAIGALLDIGFALALHGPPPIDLPPRFWVGAVFLAIMASALPYPLYFELFRKIGGRAAYVGVATPVLAMVISTMLEAFRWTGLAIGGSVLALAGMLVAMRSRGD